MSKVNLNKLKKCCEDLEKVGSKPKGGHVEILKEIDKWFHRFHDILTLLIGDHERLAKAARKGKKSGGKGVKGVTEKEFKECLDECVETLKETAGGEEEWDRPPGMKGKAGQPVGARLDWKKLLGQLALQLLMEFLKNKSEEEEDEE